MPTPLDEPLTHRYFPEWADRPVRDGTSPESERNSYSAGGYAEEFGYSWQSGVPAPLATFVRDPESSQQWCVFVGCLHPGYPECPKPFARDGYVGGGYTSASGYANDTARAAASVRGSTHSGLRAAASLPALHIIRVDEAIQRKNHGSAARLWRVFRIRLRAL